MKSILTFLIILTSATLYSQTIKKEYYDPYYKTKIMAKYQTNSAGEKHGWFKGYNQQGVVVYEYNYKNNLFSGLNKEYVTYSGSRTLAQSETYKEGGLHGPAVYYAKGNRVMGQGSYFENKKTGKWTHTNPFDGYGFSEDVKKGAKYIKFEKHYDNGIEIFPDGEYAILFLPSGKKQASYNYLDGLKTGEWIVYFPTGKIQTINNYKKGKLVGKQVTYNKDGTIEAENFYDDLEALSDQFKDSALVALENNKYADAETYFTKMKSWDDAKRMKYMSEAVSLREQKKYLESIKQINFALKGIQNPTMQNYWQEVYKEYISELDSNFAQLIKYESTEGLDNELKKCQGFLYKEDFERYSKMVEDYKLELKRKEEELKAEIKRKEEELKQLNIDVHSSFDTYKTENVKQVQTLLVDATTGKPIMKDKSVKGKFLYKKSMIILDPYINEFNKETDLEKKKVLGKRVMDAIEILNNIPESEWKAINKQLKKVDDPEQIKSILKI